jgi:hypothetical protein
MTSELQEVAAPTDSIVDKETDGRRQRSERSRDQIIEAVLELIGEGDLRPVRRVWRSERELVCARCSAISKIWTVCIAA